jgi:hypothetical protein
MTKSITLTRGKFALVDDEDFEWLNQHKWHCSSSGYAIRKEYGGRKDRKKNIFMHRLLMSTPEGQEVDHINMNRLDNRKENLRNCTRADNIRNGRVQRNNNSGYIGVSRYNQGRGWQASISVDGTSIYLGHSVNITEMAKKYDEAAKKYHGEFASLNFPVKGE